MSAMESQFWSGQRVFSRRLSASLSDRLPDEVVVGDDDAPAGREERAQALERALDVVEVPDRVAQDDRVEGALGAAGRARRRRR